MSVQHTYNQHSTGKYAVLLAHIATVNCLVQPRRSTKMSAVAARRAITVGGGCVAEMAAAAVAAHRSGAATAVVLYFVTGTADCSYASSS